MTKDLKNPRVISRRDTLKVCIVPATAALTGRLLAGCSAADSGSDMLSDNSGGAPAAASSPAANSSTTATISTAAKSGSSTPAAAGAGAKSAAGSSAANSVSSAAGSNAAPSGTAAAAAAGSGGAAAQSSAPAMASAGAGAGTTPAGAAVTSGAAGAAGAAANGAAVTGMGDASVMWATGGTAKLAKSYEDPFQKSPGTSCKVYPTQTIGPCYSENPMMRSDISDGLDGLPLRLSFLVVGKDGCTPVPNATVDIWHSGSQGIYSAYAMGTTCNPGNDNVLMKTFCRGVQPVDETGRVNFSTVFPGWYTGRTLHIHFTIRVGGKESVTSQLYFEDALVDEILAQGIYKARGKRDTNNTRDMLFSSGNATPDEVIMDHVKRPDGVLHAWKVLSIG